MRTRAIVVLAVALVAMLLAPSAAQAGTAGTTTVTIPGGAHPGDASVAALPVCDSFVTSPVLDENSRPTGDHTYVPSTSGRSGLCKLQRGHRGAGVYVLQGALNDCNQGGLVVDAIYGPHTEAVIFWWQAARGARVDGVYGPETATKAIHWGRYNEDNKLVNCNVRVIIG